MSAKENNAVGKLRLGVEMNHLCAISRSIMYPWFMTDKGPPVGRHSINAPKCRHGS